MISLTRSLLELLCVTHLFLKNIRSHNSYHGCERCTVKGVWEGRVVFDGEFCELRSEERFNAVDYEDHQNGPCPLVTAGVLCIKNFPIEYMHLVCLGVVKRMLLWLIEGPLLWLIEDSVGFHNYNSNKYQTG